MYRFCFAAGLAIAVLGFALPSLAAPAASVVLTAKLSGSYLHAAPRGSGTAKVTFSGTKVCWQFTYKGIGKTMESGIHKAPPPAAGQRKHSVLPFTIKTTHHGCAQANPAQVAAIAANPGRYYVDIHSVKYPKGAIGGRLQKA